MTEAPRLDLEPEWKSLEIFPDETASLRVIVEQSEEHGLFRFSLERFFGPASEDEGQWPDGFWQRIKASGLYASAVEAMEEARASLKSLGIRR
ncbi:hypothetical protein [Rhizobium sp. BR 315]|uniref:hypothetical protein n=1 Tax=Rhizobium sp. BR 315 TaxID=3040014 RepID=UPI003D32E57C